MFAHETGLADRIEHVRSVVMMSKPNRDVMRDNPLGKIPTLVTDDGRTLFDSIVICEYLDAACRCEALSRSRAARWQALRWHALGDGMLDTLILWRNRARPAAAQQNPDWLLDLCAQDSELARRHRARDDRAWRAPFGIGHIGVACALGYLDFRFTDLAWRGTESPERRVVREALAAASVEATHPSASSRRFW